MPAPHLTIISSDDDSAAEGVSLTVMLAAFSNALDLTSGQPLGHAQRSCLIGMRIAEVIGMSFEQRKSLYPALLLKDAGCSTNAAKMHAVLGGNEIDAKRMSKVIDWSNPIEAAQYAFKSTLPGGAFLDRARRLASLALDQKFGNSIIDSRCNRGAEIAINIGLSPDTADGIRALDEHWDGKGSPYKLQGPHIPIIARILCLSQTLEVFVQTAGVTKAYEIIRKRSGKWFDPSLIRAADTFEKDQAFWSSLYENHPSIALKQLDVEAKMQTASEARIDSVCVAFAQIVDAKSPFTADHSSRVSQYTVMVARQLGIGGNRLTALRRAALLHDLGKLSIPNIILDGSARLLQDDWAIVKKHPQYTREILSRTPGFARIADIAGAHHERLDGSGYFQGLTAEHLDLDHRILAVADVFDALSSNRPYRPILDTEQVFEILDQQAGVALDADCIAALHAVAGRGAAALTPIASPVCKIA